MLFIKLTAGAFLTVAILMQVGCATIRGFPEPPATSSAASPKIGWQLSASAIELYNAETDATKKKAIRNEIIDARMAEIDNKFGDYERAIYKEGIGSGVGTDWVLLGITAGATVSRVENTKTLLAALATALVGGQASFDKRALFEKTMPALMAQMVAERETVRATIREGEDLPVENFTWSAAESELKKFEFAGSIPGAIANISQDAGEKANKAKQSQSDIRQSQFTRDDEGELLRLFWKPDGKVDKDNEAELQKWMTNNGLAIGPGRIAMFLRSKAYANERKRAVAELDLKK